MRLTVKSFASALAAYNKLIHLGRLEYSEDLRSTRQEAFDDLREGLVDLQGDVADDASFAAMFDARSLVDRAMVVYRVGSDIDACSTLLQRSLEVIQSVQFKTGRDEGDVSPSSKTKVEAPRSRPDAIERTGDRIIKGGVGANND